MKNVKVIFVIIIAAALMLIATGAVASGENRAITKLKNIIAQSQKIYTTIEELQEEVHNIAEDARDALCLVGETDYCPEKDETMVWEPRPPTVGNPYIISVSSFNAEVNQTDNSPCIAASLQDICILAKNGERIIALSRDLVGRQAKPFRYGDKVYLEHTNPKCRGTFKIMDTMNTRFYRKGDIFNLDKEDNHGVCVGVKMYSLQ